MRNLIQLFVRYGGFLVFLILEVFCFVLIVRYNETQKAIYFSSLSNVTGMIDQRTESLSDYMSLSEVNDSLVEENARLYAELFALRSLIEPGDSNIIISDHNQYRIVNAEVIYNTINEHNNFLILNKGANHGTV